MTDTSAGVVDLVKTLVTIAGTLGAAYLGAYFQEKQARTRARIERLNKIADEQGFLDRAEAKVEAARSSERVALSLFLSAYAEACARTISDNSYPLQTGYSVVPTFPDWPKVDWTLLGAAETVRVRDIETKVRMRHLWVIGDVRENAFDEDDAGGYHSQGAAALGLDAWNAAQALRASAKVEPFTFPLGFEGWNFVETLEAQARQTADWKARQAASHAAMSATLSAPI